MHDFIQVQRFRLRFRIKFRIMGLKKYFVGKTGFVFWLNVVLAAIVLICIPVLVFDSLDAYTNHGDKVAVPSIEGKSAYNLNTGIQMPSFFTNSKKLTESIRETNLKNVKEVTEKLKKFGISCSTIDYIDELDSEIVDLLAKHKLEKRM